MRRFGCALGEIKSVRALGIVRSQDRNLKKLTEGHHKEWSVRLNLTQRGGTYQGRMHMGCERMELLGDSAGSGAWPFATGGVTLRLNPSTGEAECATLLCDGHCEGVGGAAITGQ